MDRSHPDTLFDPPSTPSFAPREDGAGISDSLFVPVALTIFERRATPSETTPATPSEPQGVSALLRAVALLGRRGPGPFAWATPFREDPIAFLLDTASDAISLWSSGGELLYRNRAASHLGVGSFSLVSSSACSARRRVQRRHVRCQSADSEYVLEVIREVRSDDEAAQ